MKARALWIGLVGFSIGCSVIGPDRPPPDTEEEEDEPLGRVQSELVGDCTAPTLSTAPNNAQPTMGAIVELSSTISRCMGGAAPVYRFVSLGSTTDVLCDWQSSNSCSWSTAGAREGVHLLRVEARRSTAGNVPAESVSAAKRYVLGRGCSAIQFSSPASVPTWTPGEDATVIAQATCDAGLDVEYKIDAFAPNGSRLTGAAWQDSPSWSFTIPAALAPGEGRLAVSVRQKGSPLVEASASTTLWLGSTVCKANIAAAVVGADISLSAPASSIKCNGGTPVFRFSEIAPDGTSTILRDYDTSSALVVPAGGRTGVYQYRLDVRAAEAPTQIALRRQTTLKVATVCTGASVNVGTDGTAGTTVALTASATGCAAADFTYRYRAETSAVWIPIDCAGSTAKPASPWSGASCSWNTTGLTAGRYKLSVVARTAGATAVASEAVSPEQTTFLNTPDIDGDGFTVATGDCWEGNASVHPGGAETCNAVDDDCDGIIDPDPVCSTPTCSADETLCDGACVQTDTDQNNCGACGTTCAAVQSCVAGSCACPTAGHSLCGSVCVDTNTNRSHCGACGTTCAVDCIAGTCVQPAAISAGLYYTCAALSDGSPRCWGQNYEGYGQLGNGARARLTWAVPTPVPGLSGVAEITAGFLHTCARMSDGTARCWGWNPYGAIGDGTAVLDPDYGVYPPTVVTGLSEVAELGVGNYHTCARINDGTVKCWGGNDFGQLGDNTTTGHLTPATVPNLSNVTQFSSTWGYACARLSDATVRCWGENSYGQLGDGTTTTRLTPTVVPGLSGVAEVRTASAHTCARLTNGTVKCWGSNYYGQLGLGVSGNHTLILTPTTVPGLTNVAGIDIGDSHSCARLTDGTVKCWGANHNYNIGDNTTTVRPSPKTVAGVAGVTSFTVGLAHTCAGLTDGTVKCWGTDGTGTIKKTPTLLVW